MPIARMCRFLLALSASVDGVLGMTNLPPESSGDKTDVTPGTTPNVATYGGGPFGSGHHTLLRFEASTVQIQSIRRSRIKGQG